MTLQTEKFVRKVRPVDAVQVTEDNLSAVAGWCNGLVVPAGRLDNDETYIHVPVNNPRSDEDSQATISKWVVREGFRGFRVISNKQFKGSYEPLAKPKQNGSAPTPKAMPQKKTEAPAPEVVEAQAAAGVSTPTDLHQERLDQVEANQQKEESVDTEFNHDATGENELAGDITAQPRDLEQAETDEDGTVQLGQPVEETSEDTQERTLCGSCGSQVVDGVCSSDINHDVNGTAPQA